MSATPGPGAPLRLVVADDQTLVRTGLRMILDAQPGMEVVGEAGDGQAAIELAGQVRPDVVLMDVRMPVLDGIEATRRLARPGGPPVRVVMLTTYDLDEYVFDALAAGASGFLLKHVPPEELVLGVRAAAAGDALIAPSITRRLIEQFGRRRTADLPRRAALASLTERELDVLRLLARGRSNAEIAAELYVGDSTVKTHVAHVLDKLGLRDRVQAVIYAYETGLVQPGAP